jgi:DNA repair protein RadA/Sms
MVFGYDANRITILIAVLEKRLNLPLEIQDVFVNITCGVKIKETSADLAAAFAIIVSANSGFICSKDMIVFGEVGLVGEVRSVTFTAEKLGFKKAIIPQSNFKKFVI